jgi:hypothetical protein
VGYWAYCHHWGYHPTFWGFYWRPWYRPIVSIHWGWWGWGWGPYWGWYYPLYPTYINASYYVVDGVMGSYLQDAYNSGYDQGYTNGYSNGYADGSADHPAISPVVKAQLNSQVSDTVENFRNDKSLELSEALQKQGYYFVVDSDISVPVSGSQEQCQLTAGDLIQVDGQPDENSAMATMVVRTSKPGSCKALTKVDVSYEDLQEMLNTFAGKVDERAGQLQDQQDQIENGASIDPQKAAPSDSRSQDDDQ